MVVYGTPEEKAALRNRYEKEPEPKPKFGRWIVQKLLQLLGQTKKPVTTPLTFNLNDIE